ncbi:hypothetical protein IEE94_02965 [Yimella sp. cx-573]|nr:hypothetical protein [Yimella sp. cx-573]
MDWPTAMDGRPPVVARETSGGCLLLHPCSFEASIPGVLCRVASNTRAYAVFDKAARGRQGSDAEDGVLQGWDLSPGGMPWSGQHSSHIFESYLASHRGPASAAVAQACWTAGVFPTDPTDFLEPHRTVAHLPEDIDWWTDGVQHGADSRVGRTRW